jgi:hypothetical protein
VAAVVAVVVGLASRQDQVKVLADGDRVHVLVIGLQGSVGKDLLQFSARHQPATQARDDRVRRNIGAGEQTESGNGRRPDLHARVQPALRLRLGRQATHKPSLQPQRYRCAVR